MGKKNTHKSFFARIARKMVFHHHSFIAFTAALAIAIRSVALLLKLFGVQIREFHQKKTF